MTISKISPVHHVIGAHESAELLRGTARGPVVIQNQRVAQVFRSPAYQLQVCVRGHREIHALSARRFANADGKNVELFGILQNPAGLQDCRSGDLRNYKQHAYRRSIVVSDHGRVECAGRFESLEQERDLVLA